ncbi:GldG family protein [Candidatus Peregrinibacteria bacterium]|nr:GldG family protein [Candidatus Peregrinibacteria bacterium]
MNFLNRFKYARDSYFITILIVAIVLMVNFIAARHFMRIDLTKNQFYAVSDASKTIMRDLEDIVTVKVFFSEKLPPNLFAVRQYVHDILDELASYSKGDLMVDFLNPEDSKIRQEAFELGIPEVQMNIVEKDKLEVKNGFLGVAVVYGDRVEILPVVQNVLNVEYDLVAAIKKVTAQSTPKIAFLTGHDEPELTQRAGVDQMRDTYALFKQALDHNYQVETVNLAESGTFSDTDTLLIAGSKTAFSDEEKYAIDQFLLSGRNAILFLDSIEVKPDLQAEAFDLNLSDMLEHYGVGIEEQFVLDQLNERASFNQGFMNFIVPYPFWIKAVHQYFDPENPIVAAMDFIVLPWASPLNVFDREGVNATVLAYTTPNAWLQPGPLFNLDPSSLQISSEQYQYPLAVLLEGEFTSFFSGDEDWIKSSDDYHEKSTQTGRLLLVGNSRFINDHFVNLYGQNMLFALNTVDFLTLDDSLISIRSKSSFDFPLKDLSARDRQLVKFTGIWLMPLAVILFGVVRFVLRRRKPFSL